MLHNRSGYAAEMVPMVDPRGRNVGVVIAKGTYRLVKGQLELDEEQEPIAYVDEYADEPGKSEYLVPADLVDFKPGTDVLVVRHAPERPSHGLRVRVSVGDVRAGRLSFRAAALGPVSRSQRRRRKLAGTFDERWQRERMPLLPTDFDPRHNQAARPKQVSRRYLTGSERVELENVFEPGAARFRLPGHVVVIGGNVKGDFFSRPADLDTVLFWSDARRVTLVWRARIACERKIEEIRNVHVYRVRAHTARQLYGARS